MNIIDGQLKATELRHAIRNKLVQKHIQPGLAIILVGNDPASAKYVSLKQKASEELGIAFHTYTFAADAPQHEIEEAIDFLNNDPDIDGILVQLPLPAGLDTDALVNRILPEKDADGFHKENMKKYLEHSPASRAPGLVEAIMDLIQSTGKKIQGMHALVCANSPVFALAMSEALTRQGVESETLLRPTSPTHPSIQKADIIISIVGKKMFLGADHTKPDAIIIDAGYSTDAGGPSGDVQFDTFRDTDVWITPVPGGVGPMTVAKLLERVLQLYEQNHPTT